MSVCLSVYLSVCFSVCVCLSVSDAVFVILPDHVFIKVWVFAMAKSIFARTVEKSVKISNNRQ